jgi:hypothetical protein
MMTRDTSGNRKVSPFDRGSRMPDYIGLSLIAFLIVGFAMRVILAQAT